LRTKKRPALSPSRILGVNESKSFTLIEILIMIAVMVVLAAILVIVVNPSKIAEKSRDSSRLSDLAAISTAVDLYLADNRDLNSLIAGTVYESTAGTHKIDGTGWIPLNLTTITSGTPISTLPVDPKNNKALGFYYRFGANPTSKTYEVDCALESLDNTAKQSADGGNNNSRYEVGTDLTILP